MNVSSTIWLRYRYSSHGSDIDEGRRGIVLELYSSKANALQDQMPLRFYPAKTMLNVLFEGTYDYHHAPYTLPTNVLHRAVLKRQSLKATEDYLGICVDRINQWVNFYYYSLYDGGICSLARYDHRVTPGIAAVFGLPRHRERAFYRLYHLELEEDACGPT